MALKKKPVTGMKDILPKEMEVRNYVTGLIRETYGSFGFTSIETPGVEHIENLCSKQGGDNEKLIFKILKRGEKLKLDQAKEEADLVDSGLRYDLTVPLSRYYSNNSNELPGPFKALQMGYVWRADRPQRGRFRQFMQCDIDILGEPTYMAEIELVLATTTLLGKLDFHNFTIRINDRRILKAMAEYSGFPKESFDTVFIILDKMDKIGLEGVAEELEKEGFSKESIDTYLGMFKEITSDIQGVRYCKEKLADVLDEQIAADLEELGVENMQPVITGKKTYIAPFVNAEKPQYLVIEDSFPNGRPALEKGFGVYMADRNTVNLSERMKVTVCLNPVHSATGPLGVVLGYDLFAHMLNTNEDMMKMARMVAYGEGLPVVADPGILSPQAFVDELFNDRFPNEYLGDTNLRLAVDVSQMVGIRFGETVKAYVKRFGDASKLTAIPLGIAGWLRYMLAVDDAGNKYELAPDPMNEELQEQFKDIVVGKAETFKDQLKPILSNERLFFTDLYKDGVGEKIEEMFREMLAGPGAVRATIHKYVG